MPSVKPRLFIGSSTEGLFVARRFAASLANVADAVVWDRAPEFKLMHSTLDGLLESVERYDFGLFVFTPDDTVSSRGQVGRSARDNVILELGLFLGQLGRNRAFAVVAEGTTPAEGLKPISDLFGIVIPEFSNIQQISADAIADAAKRIRSKVREVGRRERRIPLIRKWKFKSKGNFSAKIATAQLETIKRILPHRKIAIVCRWENETINTDDDPMLAVSGVRAIPLLSPKELEIEVEDAALLGNSGPGDVVEAYVILVPEHIELTKGMTIGQMIMNGCDIVDAVAVSADTKSARRL